ncbi:unnamed protein product [Lymnaea stagnalis]|uniref:Methionyl-tRNA formyltransferase, mitochondrial n=1 Tax=Lymnaea stagnalis TaxID=6523 RepID=A0AAV2HW93_LYMST
MNLRQFKNFRSKPPWRVLFFGTDEFSLGTLQTLNENRLSGSSGKCLVDTLHIVHPRTKKQTPIIKYAAMFNLSGHEWPMTQFKNENFYDVGVLASFGHLIPRKIIEAFPYGILNVHPSLLPRWRGAAPLHHTVLNADDKVGLSIMSIQPKHFDAGPLLKQTEVEIPMRCSTSNLRDYLAPKGGKMILEVLANLPEAVITETPQAEVGCTYAHKITPEMSFIDWKNQTLEQIDRQYRALHETTELRTEWAGTTVRLIEMISPHCKPSIPLDSNSLPGLPFYDKATNSIWVRCKDSWAGFPRIVIKKTMTAKEFYNGYLSKSHFQGVTFTSKPNNLFDESYARWIHQRTPS